MKLSRKVKNILNYGIYHDLEIVSHGLAPNVNGFCFESHGKASEQVKNNFSKMLNELSHEEVQQIIKTQF